MRILFLFLSLNTILFGQVTTKKNSGVKKISVNGKVFITTSYCGGMEPDPAELEKMSKPLPYGGKVFYIRKGNKNDLKSPIIMSFTVNSKGEFNIKLPLETYSIIQKEQVKKIKPNDLKLGKNYQISNDCLNEWWAKPYYLLELKENEVYDLEFNFHRRCFIESDIPCIGYFGPLPP